MKSNKFDEATILRFEPDPNKHPIKDAPGKHSLDWPFIKEVVEEYMRGLARINKSLTNSSIDSAFAGLQDAYSNVFGKPLFDTQELTEAYSDRVKAVADAVIARTEDISVTKEDILLAIASEAARQNSAEYKLKDTPRSTAWRDFVKDVLVQLKGKISYSRPGIAASAADRRKKKDQLLTKISNIIDDSIGYSFPDGDPIDYIMPRVERLGIETYDIYDWLDQAAKKHLGAKSFDAYMGAVFDDLLADNPQVAFQSGILSNPYTGKSINFASIIDSVIHSDPHTFVDIISNNDVIKQPKVIDAINNNKEEVLKSILKVIKRDPKSFACKRAVNNLINAGLDWNELASIKRSIDSTNEAQQMQPGDVLTIEGLGETVVGRILYVDSSEIIVEGDVIYNKFANKQAQKNKNQYQHNSEVAAMIPMYNPNTRQNAPAGHFTGEEEPYDHFEVQKVSSNVAHIIGVTQSGKKVQTSTTNVEVAHALADAFNRKGFTDKEITRVPFSPDDNLNEAEYQGREVPLGKPMPGDVKKYRVYVKDPKTGNIKKVNFGDKNMEIKRSDPERRKNFRARHGCGTSRASDRTKAAYWSCRLWSNKKVSDILKGK